MSRFWQQGLQSGLCEEKLRLPRAAHRRFQWTHRRAQLNPSAKTVASLGKSILDGTEKAAQQQRIKGKKQKKWPCKHQGKQGRGGDASGALRLPWWGPPADHGGPQ